MTIHFLVKERNIAKNNNGSSLCVGLAYVVQFGVELKSLILIRLNSDLVLRDLVVRTTVRLCSDLIIRNMYIGSKVYVRVLSNRNDLEI